MRIGVVADTHMPGRAKKLPRALKSGLEGTDLILHAGDFTSPDVVDILERIAPVKGVYGNNDGPEIRERFGQTLTLDFGDFRIAMIHGDGTGKTTEERAWETFTANKPDIVVFGHSHMPVAKKRDGVLLFNPGSPTDKRRQPLYSYGIIEWDGKISAVHHFFADKE